MWQQAQVVDRSRHEHSAGSNHGNFGDVGAQRRPPSCSPALGSSCGVVLPIRLRLCSAAVLGETTAAICRAGGRLACGLHQASTFKSQCQAVVVRSSRLMSESPAVRGVEIHRSFTLLLLLPTSGFVCDFNETCSLFQTALCISTIRLSPAIRSM
jgi:hypothetical protein